MGIWALGAPREARLSKVEYLKPRKYIRLGSVDWNLTPGQVERASMPRDLDTGVALSESFYLTQNVLKVVLQKSDPPQIRQSILYYHNQ